MAGRRLRAAGSVQGSTGATQGELGYSSTAVHRHRGTVSKGGSAQTPNFCSVGPGQGRYRAVPPAGW